MTAEQFLDGKVTLYSGDCLDVLPTLEANSIDACVTDPPYHLTSIVKRFGGNNSAPCKPGKTGTYARASAGFMGKQWDGGDIAFRPETWAAVYRVLKPGAHLVAFGGTRTFGRMQVAIEEAGFEIRDCVMWLYGSGFPKSHDVSKGIDKALGKERTKIRVDASEVRNPKATGAGRDGMEGATRPWIEEALKNGFHEAVSDEAVSDEAVSDEAVGYQGWGTALKPSNEPIVFAQKPLTAVQFFAVLLLPITESVERVSQWSDLSVPDAAKSFSDTRATLVEAGALSVQENAKTFALASIDVALNAEPSSIFQRLVCPDQEKTKECSAPSPAKLRASKDNTPEQATPSGAVDDISTHIMAMSMSAMRAGISVSTVSSWADISHAILTHASTFTIETASRLITELRIWNSLILPTTSIGTGNFKPNCQPIILARKPLSEGTVAANVLKWGTGALNIDSCRVGSDTRSRSTGQQISENTSMAGGNYSREIVGTVEGRWPANVVTDGSPEVVEGFPESNIGGGPQAARPSKGSAWAVGADERSPVPGGPVHGDSGSAARFFYTAKADSDDRLGSKHPTVKPLDLMQWLVRLVTPPKGTVLDCFSGTGTTGEAAFREGMRAVLIEREEEYQNDIRRRMALALSGTDERAREGIKARMQGKAVDHGPLFDTTRHDTTRHDGAGADRYTATSPIRTDDRTDRIEMVKP